MLVLFVSLLLADASPPPPAALKVVTFDQAIEQALARNPTIATALEDVNRALALVEQSRASVLPQLWGTAGYTRLDHDRVLAGQVALAANQFSAAALATIPLNARSFANLSRAEDNAEVARVLAADVRRLVALSTGRAFLAVILAHRVVDAAQRARDTAQTQLNFDEKRRSGGLGTMLDVTRSGQEFQIAEQQLQSTLAGVVQAQEALGVLLGSDGPLEAGDEPKLALPPDLEDALAEAELRTDVLASKRQLEAAQHSSNMNWTDYMPYLSVNGQAAYTNPAQLVTPLGSWQVQALVTLPIYDGGLRYGQAKERRAVERKSELGLEGIVRQAHSEVRVTFENLRRADLALNAARQGAKLAAESLRLAEIAYRTGVLTNLELVDAQKRSRDADTSAAQAEDVASQARLDLLSASGAFPKLPEDVEKSKSKYDPKPRMKTGG